MAELVRVHVAHVLEAVEVGHLARGEEGVAREVAGQERQAVEGDGVELGAIGDGLLDGVAAVLAALGAIRRAGIRSSRTPPRPSSVAGPVRRRIEFADSLRREAGVLDGFLQARPVPQAGRTKRVIDGLGVGGRQ